MLACLGPLLVHAAPFVSPVLRAFLGRPTRPERMLYPRFWVYLRAPCSPPPFSSAGSFGDVACAHLVSERAIGKYKSDDSRGDETRSEGMYLLWLLALLVRTGLVRTGLVHSDRPCSDRDRAIQMFEALERLRALRGPNRVSSIEWSGGVKQ